jgi:Tfp pilus assembly protein PilF
VPTPHYDHFADMAACSAQLGRDDEADEFAKRVLDLQPDFSVNSYLERRTFKETNDHGHLRDSLLKSGLPELPL